MRKLGRLAVRAWRIELAGWLSIFRFRGRRPRVPPGATAFTYDEPVRVVLITLLCVSAVEVVVVDLVVHRWEPVRLPLLVLGIWGLTFMLGLLLGYVTRPHAVGPAGLRIRHGGEVDLAIAWEEVVALRHRKQSYEKSKTLTLDEIEGTQALRIVVQDQTNLEVTFEEPKTFRIPSGQVTVERLIFSADDPRAFMAAVRPFMTVV